MKELWRKSFELFRRHLILCVPCVCAGLLSFGLTRLEKVIVSGITRWLMTQHSVLGGEFVSADPSEFQRRALRIAMPLGLFREFVTVCLFVVALVMTAKLVGMVLEEKEPDLRLALKEIAPETRGILLFTVKYMLACGVMGGIMLLLISSARNSPRLLEIAASKAFIYPVTLALLAGVAWVLMPSAMRLSHSQNVSPVSVRCKRLGTVFMVLMSAAGLALETILDKAEAGLVIEQRWELWVVWVVNNIVTNLPQVLLFIALALLAGGCPVGDTGDGGSRLRGFLKTLMPMHVGEAEEP